MLRKILFFKFAPEHKDLALLVLRLITAISIFLRHGVEKLFDYQGMLATITGRNHYIHWLGAGPTFMWETFSDGILTILLAIGLATRWSALLCFCTLAVAWSAVLGFPYFTGTSATHGEMTIAYMIALLALVCSGGGRYSIDALLDREA
jgi:putative oxidoreductase